LSNFKFDENSSTGTRDVPCGRIEVGADGQTDRRTDISKLVVLCRNFANASEI